ncbi:small-conductance mechanosensitive channel [Haloferula luteola]|uniref:Small-conductance mechanosensitive channel n=1 Tax=Haloferula luteola TaxID=595692 RepID=A0A840V3M0_9BACT|nr:mechanosensitive ion channel family protein [Haloferula luteola]MBB5352113.1 small-conductance mechanosensitive channel [Haloferula luteola]
MIPKLDPKDLWISFMESDTPGHLMRAVFIALVGLPLVALGSRVLARILRARFGDQGGRLLARILRYAGFIIVCVTILQQFGFNLAAVLGAAGVAGVAIGFASQTSLSNLISGLFIVGERPFEKGDVVEIAGITGIVEEIGLMALTVRTFDNRSVRIPNETLVKTNVTTVTRYPIRRVDTEVGVAYDESIAKVMEVLRKVAEDHPHVLDEPAPLVVFTGFGDSSLNFLLGTWGVKEDYLTVKNEIPLKIKEAFDREGIEIPFPHLVLASGKAMQAIPVDMGGVLKTEAE